MLRTNNRIEKQINRNCDFSENAKITLKTRYLEKDENLNITETIEECFERVATHIASVESKENYEEWKNKFMKSMISKKFIPNSPTIMNAGNKRRGCLSACFVLPIYDSLESIFETLKNTALIFREGGGVGINFTNLRPSGDIISSTTAKGQSTGVLSFMKLFDEMISVVKQGGTRRGAMMGILRVDHPDILNFIRSKRNNGDKTEQHFTNLNISVGLTNKFIECYKKEKMFPLINPRNNKIMDEIDPTFLFNEIVISAYKCGDPGIIFLDRLNTNNPFKEKIDCVNPCGEQPLLPFESCNLGSINIELFTNNFNFNFNKHKERYGDKLKYETFKEMLDLNNLKDTIEISVRFLDNTIDANKFPLKEIKEKTLKNRKIGLGIMGFANTLYKLKIPYDSNIACEFAKHLMKFINIIAHKYSEKLAIEKEPFTSINETKLKKKRNAVITTIAPTGSISIIADTSSGVEPNFLLAYKKDVLGGLKIINQQLIDYLEETNYNTEEVINYIIVNNGTVKDYNKDDFVLQNIFKTAHEIDWKWHIKIQEAFQLYTDNGISKTINLPHNSIPKEINQIYNRAIDSDIIKGITIFRDGCLSKQILVKLETCPQCNEGVMLNDGKCMRCDKCGFSNKCSI